MTIDSFTASRAWRHVEAPTDEERQRNKYLNPEAHPSASVPRQITSLDGFLKLEDISCYNSDGEVTENYPVLYVAKDVLREEYLKYEDTDIRRASRLTLPYTISDLEPQGLFLPSMALTCAILAKLYANREDSDALAVLYQYINLGGGWSDSIQNTVIDFKKKKVTHYPSNWLGDNINSGIKAINLDFGNVRGKFSLPNDVKQPVLKHSLQNLTGLKDLKILGDIASYFGFKASIKLPRLFNHRLGYINVEELFTVSASELYDPVGAARGVKAEVINREQ